MMWPCRPEAILKQEFISAQCCSLWRKNKIFNIQSQKPVCGKFFQHPNTGLISHRCPVRVEGLCCRAHLQWCSLHHHKCKTRVDSLSWDSYKIKSIRIPGLQCKSYSDPIKSECFCVRGGKLGVLCIPIYEPHLGVADASCPDEVW